MLTQQTSGLPLPAELRDEWRVLESESAHPSIFRTPEWVEAWAEVLGLAESTTVHTWHDDDRLVAALPLTTTRERLHPRVPVDVPVTICAGSGPGSGDHTGWSATSGGAELVSARLRSSRSTLLLRSLDPQVAENLGGIGVVVDSQRCPRLDLRDDGRPWSAKFAKRLAYYRRRAEREGCVLSMTKPGEVTHDQFAMLGELHDRRFGASSVLADRALAMQDALRRRQRADLGPVVVTASVGGEVAGILWGLWFAGVFAYYQSGWRPEYRELNLGTVLVDHAIAAARDMGAVTFDFLRGPEEYKYKFGATDRVDSSILLPHGAPGALMRLKARTRSAVRAGPSA